MLIPLFRTCSRVKSSIYTEQMPLDPAPTAFSSTLSNQYHIMAKPVNRVTLFKIPNVEDQQKLATLYRDMPTKAVKVLLRNA